MRSRSNVLGWIPFSWYAVFLLAPLVLVLLTSLATRGVYGGIEWTLNAENFLRALDPLYFRILLSSFVMALSTALLCFLIGFPVSLAMATLTQRMRSVVILLLALPFLTNLVIRICALKSITAYDGLLALILSAVGIQFDPFGLSQNLPLVMFGMVSTYLPFMIFPIYSALERFDFSLVEAAQDLGASYAQIFTRVLLPIIQRPIASGTLMVFIPAMGEFLIPDLLGGAKTMLAGNLISEQFLKARDWPFGSALSVILIALLIAAIVLISWLNRTGESDKRRSVEAGL